MRPRSIALVIAAMLIAEMSFASSSISSPVAGGVVGFTSNREGPFDIHQAGVEGVDEARLTQDSRDDMDPAWSPDGTRFAFAKVSPRGTAAQIWVGGAGGEPVRRSGGALDRQPAWSPDGGQIAFVRSVRRTGASRLFVMNANGTGLRRLTNPPKGAMDWAPDWSPDGLRIAFASTRSGSSADIWVMNANGTGRRRITSGRIDGNPSWSPDGSRIVFDRCCPDGSHELYTVDPDSKSLTRLTATTGEHEVDPAWSPDGLRIAFVGYSKGGGTRDIYTMASDGGSVRRLTDHHRADLAPHWRVHSVCDVGDACAGGSAEPASGAVGEPEPEDVVEPEEVPDPEELPEPDPEEVLPDELSAPAAAPPRVELLAAGSKGPGPIRQRAKRIAPGVTFIRARHRRGPKRVFALRVNPKARPKIGVALAGNRLRGFARTRVLARRHRALAAVNGDFALPSGAPVHAFAANGDLKRTTLADGRNFAMHRNQRTAYAGAPRVDLIVGQGPGGRFKVTRWNDGAPAVGEVAAFSGASSVGSAPAGTCAARLRPRGKVRWYGDQKGLERSYTVEAAGCFSGRLSRGSGVLLVARPGTSEGHLVGSLPAGGQTTLRWSFGWRGVIASIGGTPLLVEKGKVVAKSCKADICRRHPRTAIGYTRNGQVLLVVVDGRRRKWSAGMTLVELAREMRRLGAWGAINLDGGGSSTMVIRGKIRNKPSDRRERPVSSAVLVFRRRPAGELSPAAAVPSGETTGSGGAYIEDPASTGGLLDALESGLLGDEPLSLPPGLQEALEDYRDSQA